MELTNEVVHKLLERSAFRSTKSLNKVKPCWALERQVYVLPDTWELNWEVFADKYIELSDIQVAKQLALDLNKDGDYPIGYFHDFDTKKTWNVIIGQTEDELYSIGYVYLYNNQTENDDGAPKLVWDLKDLEYAQGLTLRYGVLVI